ncbi:hypothetical protein Taro_037973 [Colocasia esculenta]|uniref:DYW domain-containing protein n=1 Tax=Colocasia esculenta TaxID=4460 RepID=A0A843W232_COLES|nr:hypothetical protein [Colocasia esculenta]
MLCVLISPKPARGRNLAPRFLSTPPAAAALATSPDQHLPWRAEQQQQLATTEELRSEVARPAPIDTNSAIFALLSCRSLAQLKRVHAQVVCTAILAVPSVANKLLYVYTRHGALADAHGLFRTMGERDKVSWSVMVGGFGKAGDHRNCLVMFREFVRSGSRADSYTLPAALRACRDTSDSNMGGTIHQLACKVGMDADLFVSAALVNMYARCGLVVDARKLFDGMPARDLVTWTVMIDGYAEGENPVDALALFDRMLLQGVRPDKVTMVTVVSACAKLGALHKAKTVHDYILGKKFPLDVILGTAVIDMYAKCGSVDAAREVFDQMKEKNVISWSAMISAYGIHGCGKEALELFPVMLQNGVLPNQITFISILYACSHAGLVDEGRQFFYSMARDYNIEPDVKHYTCMVDILGRAGRLGEAMELMDGMTVEKDEGLWGALLGACRIHRDMSLAEKTAASLLELGPKNPGYYVLLSNIYANAGRWEDVAKVRELMTSRGLKKTPGWTWIEINSETHRFNVGDKAHPQAAQIYQMLRSLSRKMELAGYVPDTNFVLHDVDEELKAEFLYTHSEKLAIAYGLVATPQGTAIRMVKNLRICGDCHTFCKLLSAVEQREVVVRDANRFHHFKEGSCSCGDYW